MNNEFDKALRTWDFYSIAKLNGKEVKMPIKVLYTPTTYQIKVNIK